MAWKLFGSREGKPRGPVNDKFAMATRQRRMFTAQMRVDSWPGFGKLERRWCDPRTAWELDEQGAGLGAGRPLEWSGAEALTAALRAAAAAAPAGPGFATFRDEPEARWIEAPLADLLTVVATALPGLTAGVTFRAGDRALVLEPGGAPAGALHGDWPEEFVAALGA